MSSPISSMLRVVLVALGLLVAGQAQAVEGTPEGDPQALARSAFTAYVGGDVSRALADYRAAADLGHVGALWKVARIYEHGETGEPRPVEAYKTYVELAHRHGNIPPRARDAVFVADAFVALGRTLEVGLPNLLPSDRGAAAAAYFHAAGYFGDPEGQFRLGRMLVTDGADDPNVYRRGVRWLKLAADTEHAGAEALLGNILFMGANVDRNRVLGLSMLARARHLAGPAKRDWIERLYQRAFEDADDDVRRTALALAERELKGDAQ